MSAGKDFRGFEILTMPAHLVVRKLADRIEKSFRRVGAGLLGTTISDAAFRRALIDPESLHTYAGGLRSNQNFLSLQAVEQKKEYLSRFQEDFPSAAATTTAAADKICRHEFDLMGSGITYLGDPINWHLDYESGYPFNNQEYYTNVHHAPYPGGYDILYPWELSRFQHAVWLGQAYWHSGDERYAAEFVSQVECWITQNSPEYGVNWACTMDVAIRAVNWLWGFSFFRDSSSLHQEFLLQFHKSLLAHGRFIIRNLENREPVPGNHYLTDLAGLIYLGVLCPNFKEAAHWRNFGLQELEHQLFEQVHPDGADFEDSTNYHRLVTEISLSSALLARNNGHSFSSAFMRRLEKMIEVVLFITRPDGTVPQIGDSDNGRLHRLKVWSPPEKEWVDYRYLLAIGGVLFNREDFATAAGDQWEEAYWLLGKEAWDFRDALEAPISFPDLPSVLFPDVGWAVLRGTNSHLLITAGPVGQNGKGGHSHNDELGFELFASGQSWLVDTGTGCYTADYKLRNRKRSTSSHNVIRVDGKEQHLIEPEELFRLKEMGDAGILAMEVGDDSVKVITKETFYNRLGVNHTRSFLLKSDPFLFTVEDRLAAADTAAYEAFLHPHPALDVVPGENQIDLRNDSGKTLRLRWTLNGAEDTARWVIVESEFSPSYGVIQESRMLKLAWRGRGESVLRLQMGLMDA